MCDVLTVLSLKPGVLFTSMVRVWGSCSGAPHQEEDGRDIRQDERQGYLRKTRLTKCQSGLNR